MRHRLGWLPELPDRRDWDVDRLISGHISRGHAPGIARSQDTPAAVDLRQHCSPIEDQGNIGSCTAQAIIGNVEYLERRARGRHVDASRLFVYKTARTLDGFVGDTGSYIRSGIKSLAVFGAPPERYWPYDTSRFDEEPPAFSYAYGQRFRALRYYRLDSARAPSQILRYMHRILAYGLPVVFGFVVYNWGNEAGEFLMPGPDDSSYGGHAVMAIGYDNHRVIGASTGAIRIRNSWGTAWGDAGYGWLPYDYVLQGLSRDFWTIFAQQYILD